MCVFITLLGSLSITLSPDKKLSNDNGDLTSVQGYLTSSQLRRILMVAWPFGEPHRYLFKLRFRCSSSTLSYKFVCRGKSKITGKTENVSEFQKRLEE